MQTPSTTEDKHALAVQDTVETLEPTTTPTLSPRLVAMLRYAKTPGSELTWRGVSNALGELYATNMNLFDSLHHLVAAFEEVLSEPRFESGGSGTAALDLVLSPIKGCNSIEMLGPKSVDTSYTVEQFYSAMASHIWARLMLTRMDWCRDQLTLGDKS